MVQDIKELCPRIELDAFAQIEPPAQREIGLVEGVYVPQPITGEVSRRFHGWPNKCVRIQRLAARLRWIGNPIGLTGDDVRLSKVGANCG